MKELRNLQETIHRELQQIVIAGKPDRLYEPISYTLSLGGKRLRPALCLAACEMFGGNQEEAFNAAIGLEIFHNFTLLHDDIMDESPMRRGQIAVHKKWNRNIAILSGDTMFGLAYQYIGKTTPDKLPKVLNTFTTTAIEVCEGQQYDMDFESQNDVFLSDYLKMIRLKTAVLLAGSLKIGALIAGSSDEEAEKIYKFGENLGMAFQLKDDLLDAYADETKFGKKKGNDIVTNKKTYLLLKALEKATGNQKRRLEHLFLETNKIAADKKIQEVLGLFDELDIRSDTLETIQAYQQKAISYLESIAVADTAKTVMYKILEYLNDREV
jgi:geranylgeranyl diphosphate synthase type II